MKVKINDKFESVETNATLSSVLTELHIEAERGVAIAVNEEVIPKSLWPSKALHEHDEVLIIQATQGG